MILIWISEDNHIKCDLDRPRGAKGEDECGDHVDTGCDEEEPPPFWQTCLVLMITRMIILMVVIMIILMIVMMIILLIVMMLILMIDNELYQGTPWQSASLSLERGSRLYFRNRSWIRRECPTCAEWIGLNSNTTKRSFETCLAPVQWCSGCALRWFLRWKQKWQQERRHRSLRGREWRRRTWAPCRRQAQGTPGQCSPRSRWDCSVFTTQEKTKDLLHVQPRKPALGNEWVWDGSRCKGVDGVREERRCADVPVVDTSNDGTMVIVGLLSWGERLWMMIRPWWLWEELRWWYWGAGECWWLWECREEQTPAGRSPPRLEGGRGKRPETDKDWNIRKGSGRKVQW